MKGKEIIITGLICITVIECIALAKGINGIVLTVVIGVIAAVMGVAIPTPKVMM